MNCLQQWTDLSTPLRVTSQRKPELCLLEIPGESTFHAMRCTFHTVKDKSYGRSFVALGIRLLWWRPGNEASVGIYSVVVVVVDDL